MAAAMVADWQGASDDAWEYGTDRRATAEDAERIQSCGGCGKAKLVDVGWAGPDGYFCRTCWQRWRESREQGRDASSWQGNAPPSSSSSSLVTSSSFSSPSSHSRTWEQRDSTTWSRGRADTRSRSAAFRCGDRTYLLGTPQRSRRSDSRGTSAVCDRGSCSCGPAGGWRDTTQWEAWEPEKEEELLSLGYSDAHCHLDYVLLNERSGGLSWMAKKRVCLRWETGTCWYGSHCDFAHGPDDIEPREPLRVQDVEAFASRHLTPEEIGQRFVPPPPPRVQPSATEPLRCMITNCCEVEAILDTKILLEAAECLLGGKLYCTFGCHPHNYRDYSDAYEQQLLEALKECSDKAVGWGECGLDYYKNHHELTVPEQHEQMLEVFRRQARLAVSLDLPLVIHSRDAEEDTLTVLRDCVPREHPVHLHAYQGAQWMMDSLLEEFPNSIVGVSGMVMYSSSTEVPRIAVRCPLDRLVLETDAPYLSGEPRWIPRIAEKVAELRGIEVKEVLAATNANCERFYRIRRGKTGAKSSWSWKSASDSKGWEAGSWQGWTA